MSRRGLLIVVGIDEMNRVHFQIASRVSGPFISGAGR
jgi:hypothetical protein